MFRHTSLVTTAVTAAALGLALLVPAADAQAPREPHRVTKEWTGAEEAFPGRQGTPKTAILIHADGTQGDVIHYVDFDGEAIFGGDMVIEVEHGYAAFHRSHLDKAFGTKSAGRTSDSRLWPGGIVPYTVDSGVSSKAQGWIADAIAEWESLTEVRFVPRTDEVDYLYFTAASACKSSVGRIGGQQTIWVNGCSVAGSAIHEIGHAMGLYHEQSRADRDSHVTINWSNISSNYTSNFNQYGASDGADLGDYDFGSIMHYGCWAASTNGNKTITPIADTSLCNSTIGQRDGLSDGDVEGIDMLYPPLMMMAMNYSGTHGQGNVIYRIDATDASTSQSTPLFGSACVSDMDFRSGYPALYGVDCSDTTNGAGSTIFQIVLPFGHAMPLSSLPNGREATSVAMAADGGLELYAIDQQGKGWGTLLYKVNVMSGQVTDIGTLWGDQTEATSIAFDDDGNLYALDNAFNNGAGGVLYTIDTATAETTTVGTLHGDRTHATSIRFGSGGTLYGINNANNGKGKVLFLIDTGDASTRQIDFLSGVETKATALAIFY